MSIVLDLCHVNQPELLNPLMTRYLWFTVSTATQWYIYIYEE